MLKMRKAKLQDYIQKLLNISVYFTNWGKEKALPFYIKDTYEDILLGVIGDIQAIFAVIPSNDALPNMTHLIRQIEKIKNIDNKPVVIVSDAIDYYRRHFMLEHHLPFVIPEKQIYMPFLGIFLQEQFGADPKPIVKLSPSAQLIFLFYIYTKQDELYISEVEEKLKLSRMMISRAFIQLEKTRFFTSAKIGKYKKIKSNIDRKDLFIKMQPYLSSPIKRVVYVKKNKIPETALHASISALSLESELAPPDIECFAVYNAEFKGDDFTHYLLDARNQCRLELWSYKPNLLSNGISVDNLSLALSFMDVCDERVEFAVENMLDRELTTHD